MARIPYVDPERAAPEVGAALEPLPPLNILRMVANAETALRPWLRLGGALLSTLELDPVRRELAILQVARLTDAEYEWVQHEPIALGLGATAAQVEAVRAGRLEDPALDEAQRAVLRFTAEVVERHEASPAALDAVLAHGTPRQVVELLLVIGHYMTVAIVARSTGIEIDEPVGMAVAEAAQRRSGGFG